MKQRTMILLACLTVAGLLLGIGSPALAQEKHERIILTYVFNDPDHVTSPDALLAEMRRTGNLDRYGLQPGVDTTLHRRGAKTAPAVATYATRADTRDLSGVQPQAKTYDYITPDECDAHSDQSEEPAGWIKNHFAYCQVHDIVQFAVSPESVDGLFAARAMIIGFGKTGVADGTTASRWASFQFHLEDVIAVGVFNKGDALLRATLPCHGSYDSSADGSPANACHGAPGEPPAQKPIPVWKTDPDATVTLQSDAATPDASLGQQIARAEFRPEYHFTVPGYFQFYTPKGETGGIRFDSAWYLGPIDPPNRLGSIFDRTVPSIAYSRTETEDPNQNVSDVAYHIQDALASPATTYPPKDGKTIPGGSASSQVHRLYPGLSPTNQARYEENRTFSVFYCDSNPQWEGYRDLGFSCDEFPYASTYEGAAAYIYQNDPSLQYNVSVRPVRAFVNGNAGLALGNFYGSDRILDNDGYFTRIVP